MVQQLNFVSVKTIRYPRKSDWQLWVKDLSYEPEGQIKAITVIIITIWPKFEEFYFLWTNCLLRMIIENLDKWKFLDHLSSFKKSPSRFKILTWALFCNWTSNDGLWRKVFVGSVPKCIYFSSKRTEEMTSLYVRVHKWLTQIANILCDFCTVNYFSSLDFTIKSSWVN